MREKILSMSVITTLLLSVVLITVPNTPLVQAEQTYAEQLASAILMNTTTLISASYEETTPGGTYQSAILNQLGTMLPTEGSEFAIFSTGKAGASIATTNTADPGEERGTWFYSQSQYTYIDQVVFDMRLEVPEYMHYVYYDIQFFTAEYPDYVGTEYNDIVTITISSPTMSTIRESIDVNGGDFVLTSEDIPGTGYDIFAIDKTTLQPTDPSKVDWVTSTPNSIGADAGATALIGREHPVTPGDIIDVTIHIRDIKDNQFDSCVFIDNLRFTGYARTNMISRKTVTDSNGNLVEPGDTLEYSVTISNIGSAPQYDNDGPEFVDHLPEELEIVPGSLTATSGSISYNQVEHNITWDGNLGPESSIALAFDCIINSTTPNGTVISNQGTVLWDTNEDGINDAEEVTDNPAVDDGVDSDKDGETDDDDPTEVTVTSFEPPDSVIETFSEDTNGEAASASYQSIPWFQTTQHSGTGSFSVAGSYHYSSTKSFKVKLRADSGTQSWNYLVDNLNSVITSWESWFTCGNGSEEADLLLTFKSDSAETITRLKFEYTKSGDTPPTDYLANLYVETDSGWQRLESTCVGGYLNTGWYHIKLEQINSNTLNVTLRQKEEGITDDISFLLVGPTLEDLAVVEWNSSTNPIIAPMFFWDEHQIGLTTES